MLPMERFTRWQQVGVLICGILAVSAILIHLMGSRSFRASSSPGLEPAPATRGPVRPPPQRIRHSLAPPAPREFSIWDSAGAKSSPSFGGAIAPAAPRPAGSTELARQYLERLHSMQFNGRSLTRQQADEINQLLRLLAEQGEAALPVIRDFLERFQDVNFDMFEGGQQVHYGSLRLGLLDLLREIGGPDAAELLLQTLESTADPLEIALLARAFLDHPDDHYRLAAVNAALNALALASSGQWDGRDVSALFEVLQRLGDESVVDALVQAVPRWNYYATLSLAGLRDGAGIPALIALAREPSVLAMGNGDYALRVLAQVAMQHSAARDALIEQARANQVPDSAWPAVAAALAGTHIQYGNQIFGSTAPGVKWTREHVLQRIALIERVLFVTTNPVAVQHLQNARLALARRLES
jgi:hypothetical protein